MKKIFVLLFLMLFLNACAESVAMLGTSVGGASSGKMAQSSVNTAISYGIKRQTGKSPIGHAFAFAKENNLEKRSKENCKSFTKKANSDICAIVKKQILITKAKLKRNKTPESSIKEVALSLQPTIDKKFKIKYLDK